MEISIVVLQNARNRPSDPTIPLLDIYTKDLISHYRDFCSSMFIVTLLTIAKKWNPSMGLWIMK